MEEKKPHKLNKIIEIISNPRTIVNYTEGELRLRKSIKIIFTEKNLSILTNLVTLSAILPILLTIIGVPWLHTFFRIKQAELFGVTGYTHYRPITTDKDYSQDQTPWSLVSQKSDNSFTSLKRGYLLLATTNTSLRLQPSKNSRLIMAVQENQCVIVLEDSKPVNVDNSDGSGWLYVATISCSIN